MAKVLGVGGIFFTSPDPKALLAWYEKALGFPPAPYGFVKFVPESMPAGGATAFTPFKADTDYFAPSTRGFMFNLVVDDLAAVLEQVKAAGGTVLGEPQTHAFGSFGHFLDPDGNKIELWQPAAR